MTSLLRILYKDRQSLFWKEQIGVAILKYCTPESYEKMIFQRSTRKLMLSVRADEAIRVFHLCQGQTSQPEHLEKPSRTDQISLMPPEILKPKIAGHICCTGRERCPRLFMHQHHSGPEPLSQLIRTGRDPRPRLINHQRRVVQWLVDILFPQRPVDLAICFPWFRENSLKCASRLWFTGKIPNSKKS